MCVSRYTQTGRDHYQHTITKVVSSSTRPIVNQTDSEKVVSTFSVPGIAFGQGKSIFSFDECIGYFGVLYFTGDKPAGT